MWDVEGRGLFCLDLMSSALISKKMLSREWHSYSKQQLETSEYYTRHNRETAIGEGEKLKMK